MNTVIIVIILLLVVCIGGFFVYTKIIQPKQCASQKATDKIASYFWADGYCLADKCQVGYGTGATATTAGEAPCEKPREYTLLGSNACATTGNIKATPDIAATSDEMCKTSCSKSSTTCMGYDWSREPDTCNIMSGGTPILDTTDTSTKHLCYVSK